MRLRHSRVSIRPCCWGCSGVPTTEPRMRVLLRTFPNMHHMKQHWFTKWGFHEVDGMLSRKDGGVDGEAVPARDTSNLSGYLHCDTMSRRHACKCCLSCWHTKRSTCVAGFLMSVPHHYTERIFRSCAVFYPDILNTICTRRCCLHQVCWEYQGAFDCKTLLRMLADYGKNHVGNRNTGRCTHGHWWPSIPDLQMNLPRARQNIF